MANMTRDKVTLTLSEAEFSAINEMLFEFSDRDPQEISRLMGENDMCLAINHAETLVQMWNDIHLNRGDD